MTIELDFSDQDAELEVGGNVNEEVSLPKVDEDELAKHLKTFVLINNLRESIASNLPVDSLLIKEALKDEALSDFTDVSVILNITNGESNKNREIMIKLVEVLNPIVSPILEKLISGLKEDITQLETTSQDISLTMGTDITDLNLFIQNKSCMLADDDLQTYDMFLIPISQIKEILNRMNLFQSDINKIHGIVDVELGMGDSNIKDVMNYVDLVYSDFVKYVNLIPTYKDKIAEATPDAIDGTMLIEFRHEVFLASNNIKLGSSLFANKRILNLISDLFRNKF